MRTEELAMRERLRRISQLKEHLFSAGELLRELTNPTERFSTAAIQNALDHAETIVNDMELRAIVDLNK